MRSLASYPLSNIKPCFDTLSQMVPARVFYNSFPLEKLPQLKTS